VNKMSNKTLLFKYNRIITYVQNKSRNIHRSYVNLRDPCGWNFWEEPLVLIIDIEKFLELPISPTIDEELASLIV
jgi:hypothetical protein